MKEAVTLAESTSFENLTPEEREERESLKAALAEYHANPGKYGIPERGPDNRWHVKPLEPPRRLPSGFAKPPA